MTLDVDRTDASAEESDAPEWLARAEAIKRHIPETRLYRHARVAGACVERVRELAGVIHRDGPMPSTDIFEP